MRRSGDQNVQGTDYQSPICGAGRAVCADDLSGFEGGYRGRPYQESESRRNAKVGRAPGHCGASH